MITEYKSALYRISYQGVSMIENALGNPNLIQISVVLGCSIIVSPQQGGGIQYLPNGESRKWFLYGVNTKLNKTGHHFIYARLNRDGDQAYVIFSVNDYAIDGTINGENPSQAYYYVKVGEITETDALEGATKQRKITFDYGKYQTDETREGNFWQLRADSQGNEYIITKYPVLSQGAFTQYATLDPVVPSIFEGIPYDNQTIWFNPATQRVEVIGGTGGGEAGSVKWVNITGKPTWIGDTKPTYNWSEIQGEKPFYTKEEIASKYVTIDTEQEITALKHFTAGLSVGESKKKIYEENGVVYIDADVAVTGAMTFYASAGRTVSTIMDAVAVDGITITKEGNVLKAVSGSGSNFDKSAMWNALAGSTTEQINKTHLTTALDNYPTKTGSGASGTWTIDISGKASNAGKLDGYYETDFFRARDYISYSILENFVSRKSGTYNVGYGGYSGLLTVFYFGAGSTSAMEILAPYYDPSRGLQLRYAVDDNRFTSWRSFAFEDGNIASATKLQTARTLWGQSFNGTENVSGNMTEVGWINNSLRVDWKNDGVGLRWNGIHDVEFGGNTGYAHTTYHFRPSYSSSGSTQAQLVIENASASNTPTFTTTHSFNADGVGYHKYGLGVGRTAPNDGYAGGIYAGTILANNWFRSEGSTGWLNQTYGGGWYMIDENFIRTLGEKSVYLGNGSYRNAGGNAYYNNLENISEPYNCRYMSETAYSIPTGYIHPFCGWSDSAASGWTTSYVIGSIRNYANGWGEMYFGIYQYEGARRAWKAYMSLDGVNGHLYINGNLMVTGGGTFYGSDIRYKSIIQQIKLSLLDIAEAPSFVYHWNKKEMICDRLNIGGSAQYTQTILPWAVEEKNNLLTMDYATVAYTFAVHTARHLLTYESRTDKKIKKLENRVKYLEKQLKKLGYEEVRTLDDQSV